MMRKRRPPTADVLEAASVWALRVEAGLSGRDQARLEAWFEASPRHRPAFDAVVEMDLLLRQEGARDELMAMRAAALGSRPERAPRRALAAGLAAAVTLGGIGWWGVDRFVDLQTVAGSHAVRSAGYATAPGERATVTLSDGSILVLNTDSAVETTFDHRIRRVRLLKGQALFTVAHDPMRPFDVLAGDRRVTAMGTAFDVLMLPDAVRVAMIDGVVRVSSDRSEPPQILSKGEMMVARVDGATTIRKVDTQRLAGWREGVVYFDDTPLAEAVAEMNRYASRRTVVMDARAAALRVSGAFRIAEADSFAESMTDIFPLIVKRSADGQTTLVSRRM